METAIWTPDTRAPAKTPARVRVPKSTPTTTGVNMTRQPGGIISDREACNGQGQVGRQVVKINVAFEGKGAAKTAFAHRTVECGTGTGLLKHTRYPLSYVTASNIHLR